jgi:hypothetical protein
MPARISLMGFQILYSLTAIVEAADADEAVEHVSRQVWIEFRPVGRGHRRGKLPSRRMSQHIQSAAAGSGGLPVLMNEGDGTAAIVDDVAQADRGREPIVGTGDMHAGRREGRHQKVHHPLVEQKPEAAMDGDQDRRVGRRVQRREEIDLSSGP